MSRGDLRSMRAKKLPHGCSKQNSMVEQLVARWAHNPEVAGSSPARATNNKAMLYDLSNIVDQNRFKHRLAKLYERGALVDLTDKSKKSLSQNSYFHLIVSYFALQYGETTDYVKQEIVKRLVCPDVFVTERANRKTGEMRPDLRSWSDLTKEECSLVIDRFLNWSSKEAGIRLPDPSDLASIQAVRVEVDRNRAYI